MVSDKIVVELQERSVVRKGLRSLRKEGIIPAVIHNHGKDSILVSGNLVTLQKVYAKAGMHQPIELSVGGKQHLALIKDVDFEASKHQMRHMVFQAIKQNEEVDAIVPVVFTEGAEIPAERASLLVLKQLDTVQVKALPRDLPNELVISPSTLIEIGDSLSVADLVAPTGVTILTEPETQIAIVEMPKDQMAEADASAASLAEDAGEPDAVESTPAEQAAESTDAAEADK
ncbi:MAG: 50S ribosomal protein L25 [Candidatus Saccharimonadales bacterium]